MPSILSLDQIKTALHTCDPIEAIEEGFVAYSRGDVVVPPVGEMLFDNPPGDVHIKYGFIQNDDVYVIKIASGFYENSKLRLPSSNGLLLVFNQKTGQLKAILLDEGYLTDIRTAAAGAVAAKYLAPEKVHRIGIFGAGMQGRLQLAYLSSIVDCKQVIVCGLQQDELDRYKQDMTQQGYQVETTLNPKEVTTSCNLIVSATPAKEAFIQTEHVQPGTHITALGADTPEKNEVDPVVLKQADLVVADSISQCLTRGEIFRALQAGTITQDKVTELGHVIIDPNLRRQSPQQVTVADLTGVAVQDIQIAKAVLAALTSG